MSSSSAEKTTTANNKKSSASASSAAAAAASSSTGALSSSFFTSASSSAAAAKKEDQNLKSQDKPMILAFVDVDFTLLAGDEKINETCIQHLKQQNVTHIVLYTGMTMPSGSMKSLTREKLIKRLRQEGFQFFEGQEALTYYDHVHQGLGSVYQEIFKPFIINFLDKGVRGNPLETAKSPIKQKMIEFEKNQFKKYLKAQCPSESKNIDDQIDQLYKLYDVIKAAKEPAGNVQSDFSSTLIAAVRNYHADKTCLGNGKGYMAVEAVNFCLGKKLAGVLLYDDDQDACQVAQKVFHVAAHNIEIFNVIPYDTSQIYAYQLPTADSFGYEKIDISRIVGGIQHQTPVKTPVTKSQCIIS